MSVPLSGFARADHIHAPTSGTESSMIHSVQRVDGVREVIAETNSARPGDVFLEVRVEDWVPVDVEEWRRGEVAEVIRHVAPAVVRVRFAFFDKDGLQYTDFQSPDEFGAPTQILLPNKQVINDTCAMLRNRLEGVQAVYAKVSRTEVDFEIYMVDRDFVCPDFSNRVRQTILQNAPPPGRLDIYFSYFENEEFFQGPHSVYLHGAKRPAVKRRDPELEFIGRLQKKMRDRYGEA